MRRRCILSTSGIMLSLVQTSACFPLWGMDPSTSLRMTAWGAAEAVGMLWASAGYAPSAHVYPALLEGPSPRVYSCRAREAHRCRLACLRSLSELLAMRKQVRVP